MKTTTPLRDAAEAESDASLMRAVSAGDREAFARLVRRHMPMAIRLAERMYGDKQMAEDIAQEAFIRLWRNPSAFDVSHVSGARLTTWLYKVILNLSIDQRRKNRFAHDEVDPELPDTATGAEHTLISREENARVQQAIQALPERQRAAFVLCFHEELSNREAAGVLGVGVKALEALLVRARRQLRETLADLVPGGSREDEQKISKPVKAGGGAA